MLVIITACWLPPNPVSRVAGPPGGQARRPGVPEAHPAAVLQHRPVDGPVGGEPALHAVEVGVGDGGGRRAHHLLKGVWKWKAIIMF